MEEFIENAKWSIKNWWVSVLIGVLAVAFGIWCLCTPFETFVSLTYLFVALFIVTGIFEIGYAISVRKIQTNWGWNLTGGIIDLLFGLILVVMPTVVIAGALIYFVGFWLIFRSIWGIGMSIDLKRQGLKDWGWLLALSILTLIFAFLFFINPVFGGLTISIFVSIAFILYGIFRIYLGIRLRGLHKIGKHIKERLNRE